MTYEVKFEGSVLVQFHGLPSAASTHLSIA